MKALVLAAGKSTRILPVTGGKPKPLLEIGEESVLGRNLRWLASQGIREVWINLHYRGNLIRRAIGDGSQYGLSIHYSEEEQILGTAGAVRRLKGEWEAAFLVVYGDSLYQFSIGELVQTHRRLRPLATVALFSFAETPHSGIAGSRVEVNDEGYVVRFIEGEDPAVASLDLASAGVYVVEPALVETIPQETFYDFGYDCFPAILADGEKLGGHLIDGYCLGIDTPASYEMVLRLVKQGAVRLP